MANTFVLSLTNQSIAAAKFALFINPGVTRPIRIVEMGVSQSTDTTSSFQRVQVVRKASAFPTVVAFTPLALANDATSVITGGTAGAAGTCGVNSSADGAGAMTVLWEDTFQVVNGLWRWTAGADNAIRLPASSSLGFGLYLPAIAGDGTMTFNAYLHFVEGE